jgi:hypothetical protein
MKVIYEKGIKSRGTFQQQKGFIYMLYLSIIIMGIGISGWFLLPINITTYLIIHMGALGMISLISCFSAVVAIKKGYGFWKSYCLGLLIPIFLGVTAAILWPLVVRWNYIPCGGPEALLGSIGVLLFNCIILNKRSEINK